MNILSEEVIKDLSSPWSGNKVKLIKLNDEEIIKKTYKKNEGFVRELTSFKIIPDDMRPSLIKSNEKTKTIYMSFNPIKYKPHNIDVIMGKLLKAMHDKTISNEKVFDPGKNIVKDDWYHYISTYGPDWIERIKPIKNYSILYESLLLQLEEYKESEFSRITIIHRDARFENIGQKNGKYILLDYELAIFGEPMFDVARYCMQSATSINLFLESYNLPKGMNKYLDMFIKLYSLSFLNYLVKNKHFESEDFIKCLNSLTN